MLGLIVALDVKCLTLILKDYTIEINNENIVLFCRIKKVEYGIAASKITKGLANGRLLIIDLVQDTPKYPSTLIFLQLFYRLFTVTQTIMRVIPCIKY